MISCASLMSMWVSTGLLCVNDIRFQGPSRGATWSRVKKWSMSNLSTARHDLSRHGSVFQKAYTVSNFYLLLSCSYYFCAAEACLLSPTRSTRCVT